MDISEKAIAESRAFIYVDKEVQRVDKAASQELRGKELMKIVEKMRNSSIRPFMRRRIWI